MSWLSQICPLNGMDIDQIILYIQNGLEIKVKMLSFDCINFYEWFSHLFNPQMWPHGESSDTIDHG